MSILNFNFDYFVNFISDLTKRSPRTRGERDYAMTIYSVSVRDVLNLQSSRRAEKKNNSMLLERLCPRMLCPRCTSLKLLNFALTVSQCNSWNGGVSLCRVAPAWICWSLERRYISRRSSCNASLHSFSCKCLALYVFLSLITRVQLCNSCILLQTVAVAPIFILWFDFANYEHLHSRFSYLRIS